MSGGYFDDGWHGDGETCGVCGRVMTDGPCVCATRRYPTPTFDEFVSRCVSDCVNANHEEDSDE